TPCQEKYSAIRHPRSALGKKCLQHLLHKGSPGVQLIIAIRVSFLILPKCSYRISHCKNALRTGKAVFLIKKPIGIVLKHDTDGPF
ncbi:hypothetical protein RVY78_03090, partial [Veillonella sp. YH-vei2232]|uniref:hypothetical protein n=1 Tax=Veillonella absiana TaxID=3079305 RepID=UPI002940E48E